MRVEAVGSSAASSAGSAMMEMWRMSISQRMNIEMSQRVSGQSQERFKEPRKVEPAVKVEISAEARKLSGS
jgi:hypothetical protein